MADNINLAKPLKITTPGTAPIAGTVVAKVSDIADVASPWLGMEVYVEADGKTYRVTSLKDVAVGPLTKKAVDTYEAVPDAKDMAGKAAKEHTHAGYENRLSTLETASAAIFHLGIVRPDYDDTLHLQIQENGVTAVDTADAEGRANGRIFRPEEQGRRSAK